MMLPFSLSMSVLFGILFDLPDIVTPATSILLFVFLALLAGILWIAWLVLYRRY